ncbi:hypothetical protein POM88_052659 [Heracleum sosnowskyi]|uniref:Peptidase M1 membrane alanine aminopeptidase domain-containing protein n=1 Tax=Heracleum sosnowskyi TaxID=360622 RepID=A0AAD8GQM8_9APIA|nr:hypothetical protein POM88_052659 [Heracleum sosnowskyi]
MTDVTPRSSSNSLNLAVKALDIYKDYFSVPYSLPKLDMVVYREIELLHDDLHSAEANTQRLAIVVTHEVAHQWFGNLVTMEWWTHIWLNEGFATWVKNVLLSYIFPAPSSVFTGLMFVSMSLSTSLRELHDHILNSMRLHLYGITSMQVLSRFNLPFQGALETIQGGLTDGAWTIVDSPLDLHDPRLLAMTAAEHHLLEAEYDDSDANGAAFFHSVTLILMALLLLRHVLAMGDIDSDDVPYVDMVTLNMLCLFGIDMKALM